MNFHHGNFKTFSSDRMDTTQTPIWLFPISEDHNSKICNPEIGFLCFANSHILIYTPMKFHHDMTRFSSYRAETPRVQSFLFLLQKSIIMQSRVMIIVFCSNTMKLHENILNGSQVTEKTQVVTARRPGQTM